MAGGPSVQETKRDETSSKVRALLLPAIFNFSEQFNNRNLAQSCPRNNLCFEMVTGPQEKNKTTACTGNLKGKSDRTCGDQSVYQHDPS